MRVPRGDGFGGLIARPARLKGNALGPRRIFKRAANGVIHTDTLRKRNTLREGFRFLGQINHGFFYHKFAEKARILLLVAWFSIKPTRHRHRERREKRFDWACFPRLRGASPPPLRGRDRVGVAPCRTDWRLLASAGAEAKRRRRPVSALGFRSARPPTPARPRKGGGSARAVSSTEVRRMRDHVLSRGLPREFA
jgi:hypothetical protein